MSVAQRQNINLWGDSYGELKIDSTFKELEFEYDENDNQITIDFVKFNRETDMISDNAKVVIFITHNLRSYYEKIYDFHEIKNGDVSFTMTIPFGEKSHEAKWQIKIVKSDGFTWAWTTRRRVKKSANLLGEGGSMLSMQIVENLDNKLFRVNTDANDKPILEINHECPQFEQLMKDSGFEAKNTVTFVVSEILDSLIKSLCDDTLETDDGHWHQKWIAWGNQFAEPYTFLDEKPQDSDGFVSLQQWKAKSINGFLEEINPLQSALDYFRGD